jgi:hypothetical protein
LNVRLQSLASKRCLSQSEWLTVLALFEHPAKSVFDKLA